MVDGDFLSVINNNNIGGALKRKSKVSTAATSASTSLSSNGSSSTGSFTVQCNSLKNDTLCSNNQQRNPLQLLESNLMALSQESTDLFDNDSLYVENYDIRTIADVGDSDYSNDYSPSVIIDDNNNDYGGDDDDDNDDALTVLEGSYFNVPPPTPAYLDKSMDNHSYHSDFCVTARSNAPLPVRYQIATKVPPLPLNAYPLKGILKNS